MVTTASGDDRTLASAVAAMCSRQRQTSREQLVGASTATVAVDADGQ
jgi:hypothetical protein